MATPNRTQLRLSIAQENLKLICTSYLIKRPDAKFNTAKNCFAEPTIQEPKGWNYKATITLCHLSPQFFCTDATLLCEVESDKI